ncbi:MAG TPA: S53 family peptidase, partial [Mycobacteriales bacterium]
MSGSHRRKALIAAGGVAGLTAAAALIAVPASAVTPDHVPLAGTQPAWATSSAAHGAVPSGRSQDLRVYLAPKGGTANLKSAVAAVSTPGSTSYRHYLSTAQYKARFSPTAAEVSQVRSWLAGSGLHVTGVASGNRYVRATGTAAAAEKAFSVGLKLYSHKGKTVQAPSARAQVPTAISGSVIGVLGLDTASHTVAPRSVTDAAPAAAPAATAKAAGGYPYAPGFRNARPCSLSYGQVTANKQADFKTPLPKFNGKFRAYAPCGYVPAQFRAAYGVDASKLTGQGATVAITDAYALPTMQKDANQYATDQGDAPFAPGQFSQTLPSKFTDQALCDPGGWGGEEALDVEAVHGMAPAAKVMYYGSASCNDADFLDTLAKVVSDNKASIVSNSWGDVEQNSTTGSVAAYEQVFLQGAMQGISFQFSSGDNGDEVLNTGLKQADYPTSDPYVTSAGGTSTAIDANGAMQFQTGWGTLKYSLSADGKSWEPLGFLYGAGGGMSHLFNQPTYQNGVVPAALGSARAVPDVAMDADPTTGMLIGLTQDFPEGIHFGEYRIGGTSLASPLFAGIQALKTQLNGGTRL